MSSSSSDPTFDFVIVGGGTNGLTAAAYLAKEGLSTIVLEQGESLGGGAQTREITLPGFKHDIFATSINVWRAGPIQQELELEKYGYRDIDPDPIASTPFPNRKAISIHHDRNLTLKSISEFSKKDSRKFEEIYNFFVESKDILLGSLTSSPLRFSSMMEALEQSDSGLDFLQLSYMSARDWLEENFESEEMRAFVALWGSNHVPLSPEDAGSALFALVFAGLLQYKGAGVPIGGIQTVVFALRACVEYHGGTISVGERVSEILIKDGRAMGVKTAGSRTILAKRGVISNVEPKSLFLKLVPESALEESFRKKVSRFRFSKVAQVMIHAALDGWLDYRPPEIQKSGIVQIGDSLDEISRAYNDCIIGQPPSQPFMTIDNTTCYDNTRAPKEKHILWNFVRAPVLIERRPWTPEQKEGFANVCIDRLSNYAPNAKKIILKKVVLCPQDIESLAPNIVNGDPGGGKATLDQSLGLRPFPNWSEYKTPISGLYLCGPATHPGGGVAGLSGRSAALVAIQDSGKYSA